MLIIVSNVALALGYFPNRFKHAQVVIIPKKTKAVTVNEYRSFSLLEVPVKLLERPLDDRVQQHMEEIDVFQDEQFGFRRHRWTQQVCNLGKSGQVQRNSMSLLVIPK